MSYSHSEFRSDIARLNKVLASFGINHQISVQKRLDYWGVDDSVSGCNKFIVHGNKKLVYLKCCEYVLECIDTKRIKDKYDTQVTVD